MSDDEVLIERARFLATQARDPAAHYQHSTIGFNYRMSNVLAGIGRGQLSELSAKISRRRKNFDFYRSRLEGVPGIEFMPIASWGQSNHWLTCINIDGREFGASSDEVRIALERSNIESRPVWKPLHLQPVFASCRVRSAGVSESVFRTGLCLPSGSNLSENDLARVCDSILQASSYNFNSKSL